MLADHLHVLPLDFVDAEHFILPYISRNIQDAPSCSNKPLRGA